MICFHDLSSYKYVYLSMRNDMETTGNGGRRRLIKIATMMLVQHQWHAGMSEIAFQEQMNGTDQDEIRD